jgi:hypothetical protein
MTFAAALYGYLAENEGITAIVASRIYPVAAPSESQSDYPPTLVFAMADCRDADAILPSYDEATWKMIALAGTHAVAHELADAVKGAIRAMPHQLGGVALMHQSLRSAIDDYDPDFQLYAVELTFNFTYVPARA